jgi:proton-coupled amino acid transporter
LVPLAAIANILHIGAFLITMYFIFEHPFEFKGIPLIVSIDKWPSAISTIIFAVNNIRNAMSIENEMRDPQKYLGFMGVSSLSAYFIAIFYTIVGFFSFARYKDDIKGIVTLNLPMDKNLAIAAKIFIGISVLLSIAFVFYICMEIILRKFLIKINKERQNVYQFLIRTALVVSMAALSILIPNFEVFISLVGIMFSGSLVILIPVLVDTIYRFPNNYGYFKWKLWINIFLLFLFFIVLFRGTYDNITAIINLLTH